MKKVIIFFITLYLFASPSTNILKNIKKTSPDYNFAVTLAKKTDSLKNKTMKFNSKVTNQNEYVNKFLKLVNLYILKENLPKKTNSLNKKISILSSSEKPIDKLQFLYYKKLLEINQNELDFIKKNLSIYEKNLFNQLKFVTFDEDIAKKNITYFLELLIQKQKKLNQLNIDLQKWQLLNNKEKIIKNQNLILENLNKQKEIYENLVKNRLIFFFIDLKDKDKNAFNELTKTLNYAKKVDNNFFSAIFDIGTTYEKKVFEATTFFYSAKNNIIYYFNKFLNIINYPIFKVDNRNITLVNFILFILIIVSGFYLAKKYEPMVIFEEMADSSLNFELFVWVKDIYARRPRGTKNKFLRLIYKVLNDANINIPFPQQDLYVKELPELKIKKD